MQHEVLLRTRFGGTFGRANLLMSRKNASDNMFLRTNMFVLPFGEGPKQRSLTTHNQKSLAALVITQPGIAGTKYACSFMALSSRCTGS